MLFVTPLGHASLAVRSKSGWLFCDPIFADRVSGGGNLIDPPRKIDERQLAPLIAILITHHHSDHFDPELVARLVGERNAFVVAPVGSPVIASLAKVGVVVRPICVGETIQIDDIYVTATPSAAPFVEVGYAFMREGAVLLNLCDSILDEAVTRDLRRLVPAPDLVLAPFQAGGYMSFLPLRIGGPPAALAETTRQWADEATRELVANLASLSPGHVVPFADGIAYEDDRINAWHFPLGDEIFVEALTTAGIRSSYFEPGASLEIRSGSVKTIQSRSAVAVSSARRIRRFDPTRHVGDHPHQLVPFSKFFSELDVSDDALLAKFRAAVDRAPAGTFESWGLELVGERGIGNLLSVDSAGAKVRPQIERTLCPFGVRLNRYDGDALLSGRIPAEWIELSGAFRYWSDPSFSELEAIRSPVLRPFRWLEPPDAGLHL